MKFKIKLILFLVGLIVILVGGLIYYLDNYFENYFKDYTLNSFHTLAELSEGAYLLFINTLEVRTVDWSSDTYIRSAVEEIIKTSAQAREPSVKALNNYLKNEKIIYNPDVLMIDILDKDGIIIASSKDERLGVDEKKEELNGGKIRFIEAIQADFGKTFVAPVIAEEDEADIPMIHVTTRIFASEKDKSGNLVPLGAVMLVHFANTDKLRDVLIGFRPGEDRLISEVFGENYKTADIYIVNKDRLMITPSRLSNETILRQKVDTEPVKTCLERGEEIKSEYLDYRGQPVFGASMCIKKDELVLVLETESREVLAPLKELKQRFILAGILSLIAAVLAIIFLSNWFLKNLVIAINTIKKISKESNLNARINVNSKDEIGYLAGIFNQMLDNIQKKDRFILLIRDVATGVNEAKDINEAYQMIVDKICFYGNWPIGHVYFKNRNFDTLISTQIWHFSNPEKFKAFKDVTEKTNFEKGVGLPGRILESKSPIWISDVAKDSNFSRVRLMENINIGAAFGFPVISEEDNSIIAVFEFFSTEPKEMENGFFEVIKNLSFHVSRAVGKIIFKERLREMNIRLEERVKERTVELVRLKNDLEGIVFERTRDLNEKLAELEKFKQFTVDREFKMIELKKKITELQKERSQS